MGEIIVNGKTRAWPVAAPLPRLLEEMGLTVKWVLVERNGEPVERVAIGSTTIEPGDRLEIAAPMAGG